ncbi:NIPSNAP family protein [Lewinella sp. JB7]|uniref:NIPSNAP family protein n=1 Tax=Lewinella sp. JB7 TaxID=2962887 RepID=UPI0020C93C96|nr:NIPSNAP family protein [Lewinella sp. JB7]MCP9236610.1 NIPSNAP family protein [Lewinella sp. JB7]
MKRRKFIQAGTAGAVALAASNASLASTNRQHAESELIEWRTYEMNFGGNQGLLMDYLNDALRPALLRKGVTQFVVFKEYGDPNPAKVYVMISYPDAATYIATQDLSDDGDYTAATADYDAVKPEKPIYTRFSSWLLTAFTGMPQSVAPDENAGLFELRIYEGYSEDAVRRKIRMFNDYEIEIFDNTGLKPVFYGDMIAGPHRPALMYLLQFEDMEARNENWGKFGADDTWNRIKVLPEFANSVSNIRRTFLVPA